MSEACFVARGGNVFLIPTESKGAFVFPTELGADDILRRMGENAAIAWDEHVLSRGWRRPIPEIRARAATSRYWAQRLRWLRKRGRA